jgi:septum formation topological specificity factor MinE
MELILKNKVMDIIKKYPELDEIAVRIAMTVLNQCNTETIGVESEMPYKAQYVLEMIIQKLEERV